MAIKKTVTHSLELTCEKPASAHRPGTGEMVTVRPKPQNGLKCNMLLGNATRTRKLQAVWKYDRRRTHPLTLTRHERLCEKMASRVTGKKHPKGTAGGRLKSSERDGNRVCGDRCRHGGKGPQCHAPDFCACPLRAAVTHPLPAQLSAPNPPDAWRPETRRRTEVTGEMTREPRDTAPW